MTLNIKAYAELKENWNLLSDMDEHEQDKKLEDSNGTYKYNSLILYTGRNFDLNFSMNNIQDMRTISTTKLRVDSKQVIMLKNEYIYRNKCFFHR